MDRLDRLIEQFEAEGPQGMAEAREWVSNITPDDFQVTDPNKGLPTLTSLIGSCPDITDGKDIHEYLDEIRGGRSESIDLRNRQDM